MSELFATHVAVPKCLLAHETFMDMKHPILKQRGLSIGSCLID
jgi:hypothetical protein